MSAPTPSIRGTPSGIKIPDGFSSKFAVALSLTLSFWEKTTQPPTMDGGERIDQTTMHNTSVKTYLFQSLCDFMPVTFKAAYDPIIYNQILLSGSPTILNVNTTGTWSWRDGTTLCAYGAITKLEFDPMEIGKQPEVTVTFSPSNVDSSGAEQKPVLTNVAGT